MRATNGSEWPLIAINGTLLLIASAVAVAARDVDRNSLARHSDWQSTKPTLALGVMGAGNFVDDTRPLTGNRLDLAAWFGFQEVIFKQPLDLVELDAVVRFEPDGYVNVLFDVRDDGFSGVRISSRRDLPSLEFGASPDGAFISTSRLALAAPVPPNVPHAVRIHFTPDSEAVFLDGQALGRFARVSGLQRIGFRGGQRQAWIDDVVLQVADGRTIRESFSNNANRLRKTLTVFALGALMLVLSTLLLQRWLRIPAHTSGLWMVIGLVGLVGSTAGAYGYELFRPRPYPDINADLVRQEARWMKNARERTLPELQRTYGDARTDRAFRLLVLGSSQTWGAGASREEDAWVRRLERLLNARGRHRRVECMNAGVSGLTAAQVADFEKDLLPLHPQAAVVNMASNDRDSTVFRASMDSIVATLRRANIAVVLLQEPNSPERRVTDSLHGDLAAKHRMVAEIGRKYDVPVIDMQTYLTERNGTGMLWWDFVHLTSYGQRLFADKLAADLPSLLHLP